MYAAVALLYYRCPVQYYIASQPRLLHTGLRVLPASNAPHNAVGMLKPWAADLPLGFQTALISLGGLWGHLGLGCACLADHFHMKSRCPTHVLCTLCLHVLHGRISPLGGSLHSQHSQNPMPWARPALCTTCPTSHTQIPRPTSHIPSTACHTTSVCDARRPTTLSPRI